MLAAGMHSVSVTIVFFLLVLGLPLADMRFMSVAIMLCLLVLGLPVARTRTLGHTVVVARPPVARRLFFLCLPSCSVGKDGICLWQWCQR